MSGASKVARTRKNFLGNAEQRNFFVQGREMQQQSCTFVHCDCAAFEATAIELFTIEANYVAMENFYATEMGKIHFFHFELKIDG